MPSENFCNTGLSRKRKPSDSENATSSHVDSENTAPAFKRVCTGFGQQHVQQQNVMQDITNGVNNSAQEGRRSKKRGRPASWEEASPRCKNARVALFSILGEAGMLAKETQAPVPMLTMDGQIADPHQIVPLHKDAHALVNGSNNPQHLERIATLMSNPTLIKDLYMEFCSRLAKPVDITAAWKYFVNELSHYIHSQCQSVGRTDVTFEQIEGFIKQNWFSITKANALALTGRPYEEVFPSTRDGAVVLQWCGDSSPAKSEENRCEDMDVDM